MTAFERHGLTTADFDSAALYERIGRRFVAAGLDEVAEQLEAQGAIRASFLTEPLTTQQIRTINAVEAIPIATRAAAFQQRIGRVEIDESFEGMDNLRDVADDQQLPWTFSSEPYASVCGEWAGKDQLFWTRHGLTEALVGMGGQLMLAGYGLHFEEGFRPFGVQEGQFRRRYKTTAEAHPRWTHEEILLESKSKTAYTPRFASHKGGAAADIRVRDLQTGALVDIGHEYPDGGALVALDSPLVTQAQWENRMILAINARRHGMSLYPFEDWHVCKGDTTAAACSTTDTLSDARYGPIKSFDLATGQILAVYEQSELDETFPYE